MRQFILIIEDDADMRATLQELLDLSGYEARLAYSGENGIMMAQEDMPALILCDLSLPDMNGFDVLQALSEDHLMAEIPVIVISGQSDRALQHRAIELGAVDFLLKPFNLDKLLKLVGTYVQLSGSVIR